MIFENLIKKYNLQPNQNLEVCDLETYVRNSEHLLDKWENRLCQGCYIDLALIPEVWFKAIDEALDTILEDSPGFIIYRVKIKCGGIRFQLGNISDAVFDGLQELERVLYDSRFVY